MCLPIAVDYPHRVLGQGIHLGFEWVVTHNKMGHRCGYVRVGPGHPWHGQDYDDVRDEVGEWPDVHGGLTFASPDKTCDRPGEDDGWWFGFDFAHADDGADPSLPSCLPAEFKAFRNRGHVWTQVEVEAECRKLCEQAASVLIERED